MAQVHPFKAVFPFPQVAAQVAAPPYDVVSADEAAALAAGNPLSFFHVSRSEIDLPKGTDAYSPAVYEQAKANYERIRREAPLFQETEPVFYLYSLVMQGRRQTGVVVAASVDDYDRDIIKKHEKTRRDKEDDRTRHILTLRSQTGPVFLTCKPEAALNALAERIMADPAFVDFTAGDGIRHTVWRVAAAADVAALRAIFGAMPALYIADGHHRAASASRVRKQLRAANPRHTGDEEYNRFLAVVFPADQLQILPYNRVVQDLNGLTPAQFLKRCEAHFQIRPVTAPVPDRPGTVHVFLGGQWLAMTHAGDTSGLSPMDRLDVSLLQNLVLGPVLGIDDPRTSKRIEFVGGIRGTACLEEKVRGGGAEVAFSMYPTTVDQLMDIADAGGIMPPKSTWFEPKLRDAVLIHDLG